MILYYDRDGSAIVDQRRAWQLMGDMTYSRVAKSTVTDEADPSKTYDVSTVWLGLDHSHGMGGPPLIFETMTFASDGEPDECERYSTEQQAREGHEAMVKAVAAAMEMAVVVDTADSPQ